MSREEKKRNREAQKLFSASFSALSSGDDDLLFELVFFQNLMPPLDSLSRRLLRQAVLRVHPDVFAGADLEAASFNAESLVVREKREWTDEGVADFVVFYRSAQFLCSRKFRHFLSSLRKAFRQMSRKHVT